VDFLLSGKLVIETHGAEFHASQRAWEKDRERVLWLRSQGWVVIELTFKQVEDWHGVERLIRNALKNPRYRSPAFLRS
jgi:very-short-patch-repair endonuclease